jgi:hypothetical protein
MRMMYWARFIASVVVPAERIPVELVDRFVDYCIDCECKQGQSTDLWPENDLPTPQRDQAHELPENGPGDCHLTP